MEHSAIPTKYRGIQFRSRLEAKWACVFDSLGWKWEYEPIDLNGWIPDFIIEIKHLHKQVLAEIKPITGDRVPRDVYLKIEQSLGAPHSQSDSDTWTKWFSTLEYEPLVCGAKLVTPPYYERNHNQIFGVGWHFQDVWGWWEEYDWADSDALYDIWLEAGNTTQWKAPR